MFFYVYLVPLILTIIIELLVIFLLGFRDKKLLFGVTVINIITNPLLNFLVSHTINLYMKYGWNYILFLEAIVVIAEYLMLKVSFKKQKIPFFKLSLAMNVISFLIGILLF